MPFAAGAIRWDAWYDRKDASSYAQDNLYPLQFRDRAPIHCTVGNDVKMNCTGTADVIEAEIKAAATAGLKFWAFDWFPEGSSFRKAWTLYQASPSKHLIDWCPIVGVGSLGSATKSATGTTKIMSDWAALMVKTEYFKVKFPTSFRPVVFIHYIEKENVKYFGSPEGLQWALKLLRDEAARAGAGNPYIILFDPTADPKLLQRTGADAISNYIAGFKPKENGNFLSLDSQVRDYWGLLAASGVPTVPIAQVGWDTRPRKASPPPWEKSPSPPARDPNTFYEIATPQQFASQVAAAKSFIRSNPASCPSGLLLMYSWDECDEGGCIMPTLGDPRGEYLHALRSVLL